MPETPPTTQPTEAELAAAGLRDAPHARHLLLGLAGRGVSDDDIAPLLPMLLAALRECPDPDRALGSFARWFGEIGSPYTYLHYLLRHAAALNIFCLVTGSSQYFADVLTRSPEYFEILAHPGTRGGTKTAATLYRDVSALVGACHQNALQRDALRRWKSREMLRIGVRDLLGLADLPATTREFSNLADACVQCALDIAAGNAGMRVEVRGMSEAAQTHPFCVIGMGKLGGQELNYSSDIDLMFVHGDNLPETTLRADGRPMETATFLSRLAESLIKILSEESANGHVFRVDMRLRPEGRFGALTRSLSGFRAYYESWAESWERQALLKARFIAGDRALGEAFMAMATPYTYRPHPPAAFVQDIAANKRRIETTCELAGETETNIKTGYGGIRDLEFIVQCLQLRFGGSQPRLRTPNTLSAIQRLHHARLLTDAESSAMADDYRFLRTLEHRLQLLHGFQTQTLPPVTEPHERYLLARRMGFADLESFESELHIRRNRVHVLLETLFYAPVEPNTLIEADANVPAFWAELNTLLDAIETPAAQEILMAKLAEAGFREPAAALESLRLPMLGNAFGGMPPDTPDEFKLIAPRLLELVRRSPDPDAGLAGIEALATAVPNRAQLYAAFDDSPDMMAKFVLLAAAAPPLLKRLTHHLEWLDALLEEEGMSGDTSHPSSLIPHSFSLRLQGAEGYEAKLREIALYHQREMLFIGARDVWEEADTAAVMSALTRLAETTLAALLAVCAEPIVRAHSAPEFAASVLSRIAVLGLGKLGGAELGYSSDWDVVFVYDEHTPPPPAPPPKTGEGRTTLLTALPLKTGEGQGVGAKKQDNQTDSAERFALANTLVERVLSAVKTLATQGANVAMDLRLRPWGRQGALISPLSVILRYYREAGETWERQAASKARFVAGNARVGHRAEWIFRAASFGRGLTDAQDTEIHAMKARLETERLKWDERDTDLKLGHGGLTDIEWLAQKRQIRYGRNIRGLRLANTPAALSALASARLLDNAEADALTHAYTLLSRLRNALWLHSGTGQDIFPSDGIRRRILARTLGYGDTAQETAEARLAFDVASTMQETRRIFLRRFA